MTDTMPSTATVDQPTGPNLRPVAFRAPGNGTRVGVEIDGETIRVVTVTNGTVTDYRVYKGGNLGESLTEFKEAKHGEYQVAWSGAGLHLERVVVPPVPEHVLTAALSDAARKSLPSDVTLTEPSVAAVPVAPTVPGCNTVIVGARGDLTSYIRTYTGNKTPLFPGTFLYLIDGVYLALRSSAVEMTLVVNSRIAAHRTLPVEDADHLAARHNVDDLKEMIAAGNTQDSLRMWTSDLVLSINDTLNRWRSENLEIPDTIWVHGPGSLVPNLPEMLVGVGLAPKPAPLPFELQSLGPLAAAEWLSAYPALLAAFAEVPVTARFSDPERFAAAAQARARSQSRQKLMKMTIGVLAAFALAFVPVMVTGQMKSSAERTREEKETEYRTQWAPIVIRQEQVAAAEKVAERLRSSNPALSEAIRLLESVTSPDVTLEGFSVANDGINDFEFKILVTVADPSALANYLRALEAAGAKNVRPNEFVPSAENQSGAAIVNPGETNGGLINITFVFPRKLVEPEKPDTASTATTTTTTG